MHRHKSKNKKFACFKEDAFGLKSCKKLGINQVFFYGTRIKTLLSLQFWILVPDYVT